MTARDQQIARVRRSRNVRLSACDWTQLPDAPLSSTEVARWQAYRQALRDLPATADENGQVEWPARPS